MTTVEPEHLSTLLEAPRVRPLVFVSVGSDHHRFDRLVGWIDTWAAEHDVDCVVQHGTATAPTRSLALAYLDHAVLQDCLRAADVVVVQGGPMSIIEARRNGSRPIVVPRVPELREVVDGHQVVFCRKLAAEDMIDLAEDEPTLRRHLDRALAEPERLRVDEDGAADERLAVARGRLRRVAESLMSGRSSTPQSSVLLLGGAGRSGSTLLERMLGESPSVASVGETVHLWERGLRDDELCGCGLAFHTCPFWAEVGDAAFGGWSTLDPDAEVRLRRAVVRTRFTPWLIGPAPTPAWRLRRDRFARRLTSLYAAAAAVDGSAVLVDSSKHPAYAMLLRRARVDLRCVLVVRDPRAVAYSWQRSVRRPEIVDRDVEMPRYSPAYTAVTWELYSLLYRLLGWLGVPLMVVRYEDLMSRPEQTLREVLGFAGITDPEVLPVHEDEVVLTPGHTVAGNPMRFQTGPVPLASDDTWRREMPRRDALLVGALTWFGRRRYGYR